MLTVFQNIVIWYGASKKETKNHPNKKENNKQMEKKPSKQK